MNCPIVLPYLPKSTNIKQQTHSNQKIAIAGATTTNLHQICSYRKIYLQDDPKPNRNNTKLNLINLYPSITYTSPRVFAASHNGEGRVMGEHSGTNSA